jgi:hypothetical protein
MLARADLDFTLRAERTNAPQRRAPNRAARALAWVMRPALLRPVAFGVFLAFVAIVSVNALMLQRSRHPAPLLGLPNGAAPLHPAPAAKPVKVDLPAAPPEPAGGTAGVAGSGTVSAPAPLPTPGPVLAPVLAPASAPVLAPASAPVQAPVVQGAIAGQNPASAAASSGLPTPAVPPPRPHTRTVVSDPIARLLGADPIGSGLEPNKTVLMAQRALQKVGYVVRPDGVMGATTRQALAQFERDHRLPAKGELSRRVRRELSTLSGIPVE